MKLKILNPEEKPYRSQKPQIRFAKTITINRAATQLLKVKKGDFLVIALDEETGEDYYVAKSKVKLSSCLRPVNKAGSLSFNNFHLSKQIFQAFGNEVPSHAFKISKEGQHDAETGLTWHLIITAPAANEARLRRRMNGSTDNGTHALATATH